MTLHAFTDGASRGNPGDAGIGILVQDERGNAVLSMHGYIGVCTNNVAEYTALETLLVNAKELSCSQLVIHSDSELMVRQLGGRYKVRDRALKSHHAQALALMKALPFPCTIRHIPREENREADRLANRGIDERAPVAAVTRS
ncbi:MAG TPA: ribonuclease HI family protein [Bacteroidota bacterium]|nr:ribonuclease HI family protein [Bacteroidota bacterium]